MARRLHMFSVKSNIFSYKRPAMKLDQTVENCTILTYMVSSVELVTEIIVKA